MNLFELAAKISLDSSGYEKGVKSSANSTKTLEERLKAASALSETMGNKINVLSSQYESSKAKVDQLTKAFNESVKNTGAASEESQRLAKELSNAENSTEKLSKELEKYAKSADDAEKNSEELGEEVEDAGEKAEKSSGKFSKLAEKIGSGLKTAAKIGTAAVTAAGTAIVALAKVSVDSYAEYEQLAGGAAKIFDQMNQSEILQDAQSAYKELGLSANQYLAVINDVGATFAATMGDEAGYRAAQQGLKAISDYASGTGKNVNELSQKFTLITRSTASYQSIADQFSGVLPATSAAFLEQAQAAGILSDSYKTLTEVPVDEYQAAVSEMLEKGVEELGLANNTAMEAATTISGSLAALSGSWSNLITGLADDNADFDLLMNNFVESTVNAAKNIAPRIGTALKGIGKLVEELVPVAMEYIPQIIGDFLPEIADAAIGIVTSIGDSIIGNLDQILGWGQDMLDSLIDGIMKSSDSDISATVTNIITSLGNFVISNLPQILSAGIEILFALVNGIIDAIPELATAATQAIVDFASYLISGENITNIIDTAGNLIDALSEGIENAVEVLVDAGGEVVQSIINGISSAWGGLVSWFNDLWSSLFGNRNVNVSVNKPTSSGKSSFGEVALNGSHALGLDYVPFDGYIAELHKGERILTAREAREYSGGTNFNGDINIIVQGDKYRDEKELASALSYELQNLANRRAAVYA